LNRKLEHYLNQWTNLLELFRKYGEVSEYEPPRYSRSSGT